MAFALLAEAQRTEQLAARDLIFAVGRTRRWDVNRDTKMRAGLFDRGQQGGSIIRLGIVRSAPLQSAVALQLQHNFWWSIFESDCPTASCFKVAAR